MIVSMFMKTGGTLQDGTGKLWMRFTDARDSYGAFVARCEILDMPPEARAVFEEHEQRVSKQELSFLDDIKKVIRGFGLQVVWDGEHQWVEALDVQLFEGEVSFRLNPVTVG